MKNFIKSFRLTLVFCVFFSVCYILVLWIFAQFVGPNSGNAEVVELNGKVVGAANVGQSFTEDIYFGDVLRVPVKVMMQPVRPVAIKALPMRSIWLK